MAAKRTAGRRKGSRNKVYWYRKGRGWYRTELGKPAPLLEDGVHIRSPEAEEQAKKAHARRLLEREKLAEREATGDRTPVMETHLMLCSLAELRVRRWGRP